MKQNRDKKGLVAILLLLLFIILRAREFTGSRVHETVAFLLFLGLLVHIGMHRKWLKTNWQNRKQANLPKRNRQSLILAVLLASNFMISFISGVMITSTFRSYMPSYIIAIRPVLVTVHVMSALVLILTIILHLTINFAKIKHWFQKSKQLV